MSGSAQNAELDLYDYRAYEGRPKIEWPNGARLAFWVAPNIEFYELDFSEFEQVQQTQVQQTRGQGLDVSGLNSNSGALLTTG